MLVKISNYTCYGTHTVASTSENICNIIDKLVRLTAKLTEHYASDIVYDIENLNKAIKLQQPYDALLFFREYGVSTWPTSEFDEGAYDTIMFNFTPIQTWRLTHDPATMETKLSRVSINKAYF